ncbi:MAG TPA: superoxide dismutase [Alphaproteobacteria bacterium]|nr:superoxide dismutase [Alphaproteobacteria bacterium]
MQISFAELPYAQDALEPHYSARTVSFHYDKHHRTYFDTLVKLIPGTKFENMPLEEIVRESAKDVSHTAVFNNAGQVWNHDLFWRSMKPNGGGEPKGELRQAIERDFGSVEEMLKQLSDKAVKQFGSGWAWLVAERGKLSVTSTANAFNPLVSGGTALLALDVWEHAYYLDRQNRRPEYVDIFVKNLVNWDNAAERFNAAPQHADSAVQPPRRAARR